MLSKETKQNLIKEYSTKPTDVGSIEAQLAVLTYDIASLTEHSKKFPKDYSGKLGLYKKVSQRKKLLSYLKNKDIQRYYTIVKKLQIRAN